MSNNKDNGEMMGVAFAIAIFGMMAIFVYALAAFAALVLTGIALAAWNKPLTMFGQVLTPDEARGFVGRGILGAVALPVFALFCGAMFDLRFEDQYWWHIMLGGYTLGSLGVAMMADGEQQLKPDSFDGITIEGTPNQPSPPAAPPTATTSGPWSREPKTPFRFASWDDEEELKR